MPDVDLIERIEPYEGGRNCIQYDIFFKGNRPDGWVCVMFSEFKHYITRGRFGLSGNPSLEKMSQFPGFEVFHQAGVNPEDVVADLNQFRPNGVGLTKEEVRKYGRKGIGSFVFEKVLNDATKKGAKIMTTIATSPQMQRFAQKNCFRKVYGSKYYNKTTSLTTPKLL